MLAKSVAAVAALPSQGAEKPRPACEGMAIPGSVEGSLCCRVGERQTEGTYIMHGVQ